MGRPRQNWTSQEDDVLRDVVNNGKYSTETTCNRKYIPHIPVSDIH